MNYSKNTKKKSDIMFRRIVASWVVVFLIGFVLGIILNGICTPKAAETVSALEEGFLPVVDAAEPEIINLGEYKLTAYCACYECCGKTDGITASGVRAKEGVTIAADTTILPFGTEVIIDGNTYIVQDRGGAIKGNRIDVYFDDHNEANQFGVQYKEIFMKGNEIQ